VNYQVIALDKITTIGYQVIVIATLLTVYGFYQVMALDNALASILIIRNLKLSGDSYRYFAYCI